MSYLTTERVKEKLKRLSPDLKKKKILHSSEGSARRRSSCEGRCPAPRGMIAESSGMLVVERAVADHSFRWQTFLGISEGARYCSRGWGCRGGQPSSRPIPSLDR